MDELWGPEDGQGGLGGEAKARWRRGTDGLPRGALSTSRRPDLRKRSGWPRRGWESGLQCRDSKGEWSGGRCLRPGASRPRLTPRTRTRPNSPCFHYEAQHQRSEAGPSSGDFGGSLGAVLRTRDAEEFRSEGGSSTRRVASTSPGPRSARPRARGAGNPTGTGTGTATRTISPWRTGRYAVSTARSIRRPLRRPRRSARSAWRTSSSGRSWRSLAPADGTPSTRHASWSGSAPGT